MLDGCSHTSLAMAEQAGGWLVNDDYIYRVSKDTSFFEICLILTRDEVDLARDPRQNAHCNNISINDRYRQSLTNVFCKKT